MQLKAIKLTIIVTFMIGMNQNLFGNGSDDCSSLLAKIIASDNNPKNYLVLKQNRENVINLLHSTLPDGKIEPQEAYELISRNQDSPELVVLDVRTHGEFDTFHINSAKNIDFKSSDFESELGKLDRRKVYVITCTCGYRGHKTQKLMKSLGFEHTFNLVGGIDAWDDLALPTI